MDFFFKFYKILSYKCFILSFILFIHLFFHFCTEAVHSTNHSPKPTDKAITVFIGNWFRNSIARKGGKKKKQNNGGIEENKEKENTGGCSSSAQKDQEGQD